MSERDELNFNWVCKLSLAKSVLASNPCSSVSVETVLLASEDRMLVGGNKSSNLFAQLKPEEDESQIAQKKMVNGSNGNLDGGNSANGFLYEQESNAVDSFQWITIPLPHSYLASNWPIRFFAIDPHTSQNLAIAGHNGLAIYSLLTRRWKLFGNENHERDFIVTGGFLWFYDYIICGCYNLVQGWLVAPVVRITIYSCRLTFDLLLVTKFAPTRTVISSTMALQKSFPLTARSIFYRYIRTAFLPCAQMGPFSCLTFIYLNGPCPLPPNPSPNSTFPRLFV